MEHHSAKDAAAQDPELRGIRTVDYTEQKKLAAAVSRIAANINHVCRRINQTGHFYEDDAAELKEKVGEVWKLLKQYQKEEL